MSVAELTAKLSYAQRLKVGSVIVKDNRIISCGYNGTISGSSNHCEYPVKITNDVYKSDPEYYGSRYTSYYNGLWTGLKTYDHVIHSEANSISRLASSNESGVGSIMFCTTVPCIECAKLIYGAGISTVYYKHEYRSDAGIKFLQECGIDVIKVSDKRK